MLANMCDHRRGKYGEVTEAGTVSLPRECIR